MEEPDIMSFREKKSLSLFHPFTGNAIGLDENSIPEIHSQPHIGALRYLAEQEWACYVDYLTSRRMPYTKEDSQLKWRFWPVSRTWNNKRREFRFRAENSYLALARFIALPPDVLVLNMSAHTSWMTRSLAKIMHHYRRKYIAMLGGIYYTNTPAVIEYYRNADMIITHTNWQRQMMLSMPYYQDLQIAVLPLGVNAEQFYPAQFPRKLGEPGLLYIGRLQEWKGVHHAIGALAELKVEFPNVKLHIVGPDSDPEYASRLRQQVINNNLHDLVVFHGSLPYQQLTDFFQSADFLLLPSRAGQESFGMVVIESMACGTPVLALKADGGGPNEIIRHNEDGLLVNHDEIASAISFTFKNQIHYQMMRDRARQKILNHYTVEVTESIFCDIVNRALC